MIIECSHCHARYQYDETRFDGKPSKKIRCAKCQEVFAIHNPSFPGLESLDSTISRRKPVVLEEPEPTKEEPPDLDSGSPLKLPKGKRLSLAIIDGPGAGNVYHIDKPRVVIGRAQADLTLSDNESSRNHAAIEIRDYLITLEDLGSTNGTLIAGERISGPVEIQNHSEFQIGSTTLMLIVTDAE